jgi:hypothetical protein
MTLSDPLASVISGLAVEKPRWLKYTYLPLMLFTVPNSASASNDICKASKSIYLIPY